MATIREVDEIIVDQYVIQLGTTDLTMDCDCGHCLVVHLKFPGEVRTTEMCPHSTCPVNDRTFIELLMGNLFIKLHSLGLVQTKEDDLYLRLFRFVLDFTVPRHHPHHTIPQIVAAASITVASATTEREWFARSIQETGPVWTKRATRQCVLALPEVRADELEVGDSCTICLDGYKQDPDRIASLPCRHVFHRDCISRWLDNCHVCPLCRFEMPSELVRSSTSSSPNPIFT